MTWRVHVHGSISGGSGGGRTASCAATSESRENLNTVITLPSQSAGGTPGRRVAEGQGSGRQSSTGRSQYDRNRLETRAKRQGPWWREWLRGRPVAAPRGELQFWSQVPVANSMAYSE